MEDKKHTLMCDNVKKYQNMYTADANLITTLSTSTLPFVMTDTEINIVKEFFAQSITLQSDYGTSKIRMGNFELVGNDMTVGMRVTEVVLNNGENVIHPNFFSERRDTRLINIGDPEFDGPESIIRDCFRVIPFIKPEHYKEIDHVKGEIYLNYCAGNLKLPIDKNKVQQDIEVDGLIYQIQEIKESQIIVKASQGNNASYLIEAYDKNGDRLAQDGFIKINYYPENKTALDYTAENMPDEISGEYYLYAFKGEIATADLYFDRLPEKHWIPFITPISLDEPIPTLDQAFFEKAKLGRFHWNCKPIQWDMISAQSLINETTVAIKPSGDCSGSEMISIQIPALINSKLADFKFIDFELEDIETGTKCGNFDIERTYDAYRWDSIYIGDELRSVEYDYDAPKMDKQKYNGKALVSYPLEFSTIKLDQKQPQKEGHKVTIKGGYVEYTFPNNVPEGNDDVMITAFDEDGRCLSNASKKFLAGNLITLGFLGQVSRVEIVYVKVKAYVELTYSLAYEKKLESKVHKKLITESLFKKMISESQKEFT
jgi:hypothetical protein